MPGLLKKVDKSIPIPAYFQLKEILRGKIEAKEWQPGDKIPSETELGRTYGINRMTVRQAILELSREGLVHRERGRGTFLTRRKIERDLAELDSLTAYLKSRGDEVSTKILALEVTAASVDIAEKLGLSAGDPVVHLLRLRFLNGCPFFLENSHLPHHLCPDLEAEDLREKSLYDILENQYGHNLERADVLIEAVPASSVHRKWLEVKKGEALLRLEQITYLDRDRPIQFLEAVSRSDHYKYHLVRWRRRKFQL